MFKYQFEQINYQQNLNFILEYLKLYFYIIGQIMQKISMQIYLLFLLFLKNNYLFIIN